MYVMAAFDLVKILNKFGNTGLTDIIETEQMESCSCLSEVALFQSMKTVRSRDRNVSCRSIFQNGKHNGHSYD